MGHKTSILGHRPGVTGRLFLCLLSQQHISDTLCRFGFVLFDDVAIEVLRGVYAGVAQLLRHGDDICTICQKHRGHRVPERMGVDVRQIVAAGKVMEPSGDAVRVHVIAFVCSEYKPGVLPPVTIGDL